MNDKFPVWYRVYSVCRALAVSFDHYLRTKATDQQVRGMNRLIRDIDKAGQDE